MQNAKCKMQNDPSVKIVSAILTSPLSGETRLAVPEREGGCEAVGRVRPTFKCKMQNAKCKITPSVFFALAKNPPPSEREAT